MKKYGLAMACGLVATAVTSSVEPADAQLFGARQLGVPLSRRAPPGQNPGGTIRGNERFIRGNRARLDFVGIDIDDRQTFVGQQQGRVVGNVRPAAQDARRRRPRNANVEQSQADRSGTMYAPRLSVDFLYPVKMDTGTAAELLAVFNSDRTQARWGRLEVTVEQRTAILRGAVASDEDRHVAVAMARLEPGVSQVVDEIRVISQP